MQLLNFPPLNLYDRNESNYADEYSAYLQTDYN